MKIFQTSSSGWMKTIWHAISAFRESGADVQCTAGAPYLYIIFTAYDRWADPFGTVIFVVNQSAVTSIMGKLCRLSGCVLVPV